MAAPLLTNGAAAIFLSPSYVDKAAYDAGQIVASSGQALVHRVYQMDPKAYWIDSDADPSSTSIAITVGFYKGTAQRAVDVDSFFVLNTNGGNIYVDYCTDYTPGAGGAPGTGTWVQIVNYNIGAASNMVYILPAVSVLHGVNGVRLRIDFAQDPSAHKFVGNFIVALSTLQPARAQMTTEVTLNPKRVDVPLADGTIDSTYFYWSDNSYALATIALEFDLLTAAEKTSLDSLLFAGAPFLVYPEPYDVPGSVYLAVVEPSSYVPKYTSQFKTAGYRVPMRLRQVGYL